MIEANPSGWAHWVFKRYLNRLLKQHFQSMHLFGHVPPVRQDHPIVLMPNHSTWWDGFFALWLNQHFFQRPFYVMMLAEQLERFSFFRRLGAFGIYPDNPKSLVNALRYSVQKLSELPPPLLCLFPQGELLPWKSSNLQFRSGISWISNHCQTPFSILPLGMRCEFLGEQRPEVFFQFGDIIPAGNGQKIDIKKVQSVSEKLLGEINSNLITQANKTLLFSGKKSLSEEDQ